MERKLLHAFWVQTIECAECSHAFDAHPTFRFAWDEKANHQWVACRECSRVLEGKFSAQNLLCPCGKRTKPTAGHWDHGAAVCPKCRHSERLIDNAERLGKPQFRIFAVETIPSGPERRYPNNQRLIRSASSHDVAAYNAAAVEFERLVDGGAVSMPSAVIPRDDRSDDRLLRYGYESYCDLFNTRQRLHLAILADEISKIEESPVREALAIAFSDHLKTNNMMCGYAGGWRRLSPLFAIRAYRHIARPVEVNPWLEHNGRGTFPNAVRATVQAAKSLNESVEPTLGGLVQKVPPHRPETWDIRVGDARDLAHIADDSVDLVLTDPPYFDYIAYSELGHFFVPWLVKFGLVDSVHLGRFPEGQMASAGRSERDADHFAEKLGGAMCEIARVTKPGGRVAFTYQNLDGLGWSALATAMARAGIIPVTALERMIPPALKHETFRLFPSTRATQAKADEFLLHCGILQRAELLHGWLQEGLVSARLDKVDRPLKSGITNILVLKTAHPSLFSEIVSHKHRQWMADLTVARDRVWETNVEERHLAIESELEKHVGRFSTWGMRFSTTREIDEHFVECGQIYLRRMWSQDLLGPDDKIGGSEFKDFLGVCQAPSWCENMEIVPD